MVDKSRSASGLVKQDRRPTFMLPVLGVRPRAPRLFHRRRQESFPDGKLYVGGRRPVCPFPLDTRFVGQVRPGPATTFVAPGDNDNYCTLPNIEHTI